MIHELNLGNFDEHVFEFDDTTGAFRVTSGAEIDGFDDADLLRLIELATAARNLRAEIKARTHYRGVQLPEFWSEIDTNARVAWKIGVDAALAAADE